MSGGNSVYSPLPQSNSETDDSSEEELHTIQPNRMINRKTNLTEKSTVNSEKQITTHYKPLQNDREVNITLNGFETNVENNFTVKTRIRNSNKLSFGRKICFIFSILVCILTVVVFLWVLPCDLAICPSKHKLEGSSWEKVLPDIELKGPIKIVPAAVGVNKNIVLLARHSYNNFKTNNKGLVISLLGKDGTVSWYNDLQREPTDIDCSLLDIDLDGVPDCIYVGENGLLKTIEPISGRPLWSLQSSLLLQNLDFPLLVPDVDKDDVEELLISSKVGNNSNHNYMTLVSGKTGLIIGQSLQVPTCTSVSNLMLEKDLIVSYTCIDRFNKESIKTMTFQELHTRMVNSSLFTTLLQQHDIKQHVTNTLGDTNVVTVDKRRLVLENHGVCPEDNCILHITIHDERDGKENKTIWSYQRENTYGFNPLVISFNNDIKGFVIKTWEWELVRVQRSVSDDKFWSGIKRKKRSSKGESPFVHTVKEIVKLALFNKTGFHVVNISETDVSLLCMSEVDCQPDVKNQKQSLLLTDLDQDQRQELIFFTSSYITNDTSHYHTWQLQSKVRVVKLEYELNNFYTNDKQYKYQTHF